MDTLTLLLIAFGLSMDAFAVSVSNGMTIKHQRANHAFRIGIFFGSFQALMPLIGWSAGLNLRDLISGVDHWIAFGLLSLIGCKMIYESTKMGGKRKETFPLSLWMLLMLSIATSIDALAVGISFALLNISIITPILVIGTVTFILSFLGVLIGNKAGHFFEKKIEVLGGLILIGIGVKILIEHLN
ncbi:MAG: manganese efflux pump [Deltaproteobacteria bacterium]|nr:manganese efflux pump [Deltaproteobacteria bacterium]